MDFSVPDGMILMGIIVVATIQSLLVWRVGLIEKTISNGMSRDIQLIKRNCVRNHPDKPFAE